MGGKVARVDSITSVERGEIGHYLIGRGRVGSIGWGNPLPMFPSVLPDLLHDLFDINLGTLHQHILHMFSLTCSLICSTSMS
jgi:hypothetical protein